MTTSKITRWTLLLASCATLSLASCKDNDDAYARPSISVTQLTKDSNGNTLIGKTTHPHQPLLDGYHRPRLAEHQPRARGRWRT